MDQETKVAEGFTETVTPEQETPPVEAKVEPEVDWKALTEKERQEHAATRAALAKLESDTRSRDGSRKRTADMQDQLAAIHQKLDFQDERWDVLEKVLAGEEDQPTLQQLREKRQAALKQVEEKGKEEAGKTEFQTWLNSRNLRLIKAASDKEGNPVLDLSTAPVLAEVRQAWQEAAGRGDREGVRDAETEALIIISEMKREKAKVTAAPKKAKESEEEMTDTGPGAGGAGAVSDDKIDAAWVKHDREHPGRTNPYDEQYRRLLRR